VIDGSWRAAGHLSRKAILFRALGSWACGDLLRASTGEDDDRETCG